MGKENWTGTRLPFELNCGDSTWKVEKKDTNKLSSRVCALQDQISRDSLRTPFCQDKEKEHVVFC